MSTAWGAKLGRLRRAANGLEFQKAMLALEESTDPAFTKKEFRLATKMYLHGRWEELDAWHLERFPETNADYRQVHLSPSSPTSAHPFPTKSEL